MKITHEYINIRQRSRQTLSFFCIKLWQPRRVPTENLSG